MALILDVLSENSATDTVSFTADTSWSHPGAASGVKAVVALITQPQGSADEVVGITYGGISLTRVRSDARTVTELMRTYVYYGDSAIPQGTQTVAVDVNAATNKHGFVFTILAAAGKNVVVDANNGQDLGIIANPSITVTHSGTLSGWAGLAVHCYGGSSVVTTGLQTGETYQAGHDPGVAVGMVYTRFGGADAASSTYGYTTLASDDQLISALVLAEVDPPAAAEGFRRRRGPNYRR
jgi:hypothetical protein